MRDDVPDLIRHGWLVRDPDPRPGVVQVRLTHKGQADIVAIGAAGTGEFTAVGYKDDTGRQWVIGRVERKLSNKAPLPLNY